MNHVIYMASLISIIFMIITLPKNSIKGNRILSLATFLIVSAIYLFLLIKPSGNSPFESYDLIIFMLVVMYIILGFFPLRLFDDGYLVKFDLPYFLLICSLMFYYIVYRKVGINLSFQVSFFDLLKMIIVTSIIVLINVYLSFKTKFLQLGEWKNNWRYVCLLTAFMFFYVAIPQEFIFRGLVFEYFAQYLPFHKTIISLILSSIIFGGIHLRFGWQMLILAVIAGFGYGLVYIFTGNIICAAVSHLLTNLVWGLLLEPFSE